MPLRFSKPRSESGLGRQRRTGTSSIEGWILWSSRERSRLPATAATRAGPWRESQSETCGGARGAARIRTGDGGFAIRCLSRLATAPKSFPESQLGRIEPVAARRRDARCDFSRGRCLSAGTRPKSPRLGLDAVSGTSPTPGGNIVGQSSKRRDSCKPSCPPRALSAFSRRLASWVKALRPHPRGSDLLYASVLWNRRVASHSVVTPIAPRAAICGQSTLIPRPFKKIPRTITRK